MESFISMFEIPATDFQRAVSFYSVVLNIEIEEIDMGEIKMGLFPGDGTSVSGAVVHGADYQPSASGPVIYLNGGSDLQQMLDRIESNNGKVMMPKTKIGSELGFYALFIDTEGNRLGVLSPQ